MQTPKLWAFADLTSAAEFAKYSANLNELATLYSGMNFGDSGHEFYNANDATNFYQHTRRYLYYQNKSHNEAARLSNWSDPTQTYDLGDIKDNNGGFIDLEAELAWLAPGMCYTITNIAYAWETDLI